MFRHAPRPRSVARSLTWDLQPLFTSVCWQLEPKMQCAFCSGENQTPPWPRINFLKFFGRPPELDSGRYGVLEPRTSRAKKAASETQVNDAEKCAKWPSNCASQLIRLCLYGKRSRNSRPSNWLPSKPSRRHIACAAFWKPCREAAKPLASLSLQLRVIVFGSVCNGWSSRARSRMRRRGRQDALLSTTSPTASRPPGFL